MEDCDTYYDPNMDTDTQDKWTPGDNNSTIKEKLVIILVTILLAAGLYYLTTL